MRLVSWRLSLHVTPCATRIQQPLPGLVDPAVMKATDTYVGGMESGTQASHLSPPHAPDPCPGRLHDEGKSWGGGKGHAM